VVCWHRKGRAIGTELLGQQRHLGAAWHLIASVKSVKGVPTLLPAPQPRTNSLHKYWSCVATDCRHRLPTGR
jgi:hypothetical protein